MADRLNLIKILEDLEKLGLRASEKTLLNLIRMKLGFPSANQTRSSLARDIAEELQVDLDGDFYDWRSEEDLEAQAIRIADTIQSYQDEIESLKKQLEKT